MNGIRKSDKGFHGSIFASLGAVGAGFLSALCCAGPLLFVTFGVGAGLMSTFEPLRPFLTVLTFALLGLGFWTVYGRLPSFARPGAGSDDGDGSHPSRSGHAACSVPRSRTRDEAILWGAAVVALVFWSFPYWSLLLI